MEFCETDALCFIQKLEEICDDFSPMVARGYLGGACEVDVKFYETLIEGANNRKLVDLYHHDNIPLFHQKVGQFQTHQIQFGLGCKKWHLPVFIFTTVGSSRDGTEICW